MTVYELNKILTAEGSKDIIYNLKGYECTAVRNTMYSWCGYIKIDVSSNAIELIDHIQVHGSINYRSRDMDYITIGFDCAQSSDIIPILYINSEPYRKICDDNKHTYKDLVFIKKQFMNIVDQLIEGSYKIRDEKIKFIIDLPD